jgi:hypothetical protein
MKLMLFSCAEHIIVDASSNNLSLIGVLEDRISEGYPLLLPQLNVVAVVRREDGDPANVPAIVQIYFDKSKIGEASVSFDLESSATGSRVILNLQQVIIPHATTLRLVLQANGRKLASWDTRFLGKPTIRVREATERKPARNVQRVTKAKAVEAS